MIKTPEPRVAGPHIFKGRFWTRYSQSLQVHKVLEVVPVYGGKLAVTFPGKRGQYQLNRFDGEWMRIVLEEEKPTG